MQIFKYDGTIYPAAAPESAKNKISIATNVFRLKRPCGGYTLARVAPYEPRESASNCWERDQLSAVCPAQLRGVNAASRSRLVPEEIRRLLVARLLSSHCEFRLATKHIDMIDDTARRYRSSFLLFCRRQLFTNTGNNIRNSCWNIDKRYPDAKNKTRAAFVMLGKLFTNHSRSSSRLTMIKLFD